MLDRPHLTVAISPQPDVLQSLHNRPGFRGRGLLARFLYALPVSRLGLRTLTPRPIDPEIEDRYREGIFRLLGINSETTIRLRFTGPAYGEWKEFQHEVEPQFLDGGPLSQLKDWGGKLPGAAARLAGIFHMVITSGDPSEDFIEIATTRAAVSLARSLIQHARAVFELMDRDPIIEKAEKIVGWIVRQGLSSFTQRDCFRAHQSQYKRVDALTAVLGILEQHCYIRCGKQESNGGRTPSPRYEVNPSFLISGDREQGT